MYSKIFITPSYGGVFTNGLKIWIANNNFLYTVEISVSVHRSKNFLCALYQSDRVKEFEKKFKTGSLARGSRGCIVYMFFMQITSFN